MNWSIIPGLWHWLILSWNVIVWKKQFNLSILNNNTIVWDTLDDCMWISNFTFDTPLEHCCHYCYIFTFKYCFNWSETLALSIWIWWVKNNILICQFRKLILWFVALWVLLRIPCWSTAARFLFTFEYCFLPDLWHWLMLSWNVMMRVRKPLSQIERIQGALELHD